MSKYFKTIFLLLLLVVPIAFAQVELPQDNPSYSSRLNDELRSINRRLDEIESNIHILNATMYP
jgi:predicted PurR-regulated permease PerM